MDTTDELYIIGDVRYTKSADLLYKSTDKKLAIDFLLNLQQLMEEYGVVKLDIAMDALEIKNNIRE